ncbi:sporulation membrane protein YtaF [Virgibacillus profundi]|uniref:Sporulation membrane protein YtaF n=1 Tax=Virgibacillus profundi TaxID=2024555 RepID=A0A2A2IIP5_9BACI|nr:sporulation membrane protein YtaF [Virgibacillus profundi]PAV30953.1 sporulation membrane protein YtaF [Virgibacillus profundi]PXY55138.1 sporulation membrane protein YtaF [Virgibacillus profundi]
MLFYTGLFLLVIAVSLDGFGVGVTYGMRKIIVPFNALFIIMCCSGIIVLLAMTIGSLLSSFISPDIAKIIGGSILIFLGLFSLYNIVRPKRENTSDESNQNILTAVLTTPDKADLDQSGIISANEAVLLGAALALDAFGAGIGASMLGYSPILTAILIAFMSGLFVFCGIRTGILLSKNKQLQGMTFLPPILLIALGFFNIL